MDALLAEVVRRSDELIAANLHNLQRPAQPGPGLCDEVFERVYALGFRLLCGNQHEQALSVFAFLFAQRPAEPRVLSGFGHCLLGLGDAAQAAVMHSLAYGAEPDNPGHVLAMAEDLIAMNAPIAVDLLRAADVLAAADSRYSAVAERARALRALLQQGNEAPRSEGEGSNAVRR